MTRNFSSFLLPGILLPACVLGMPGSDAGAEITIIQHVRVLDGTGHPPQSDMGVVIADGAVQSIVSARRGLKPPVDARVVDGAGMTILPGLINAHGHLGLVDGTENSATAFTISNVLGELRQYEHYGVTSMLSLGLNRDSLYRIQEQQKAGTLDGATVYTADHGIGVDGGAPPLQHAEDQLDQPKTAEEARSAVDAAAARHTNFIKIWVDDLYGTKPKMKPAIYTAVIDEAHKKHVAVAAHIFYLDDAKALVAAGVDVLAHSVRDKPVDGALIAAMKQHGTWYVPTLTVDESFFVFYDHPELLDDPFLVRATSPDELALLKSAAYRKKVSSDPNTARHRADFAMASRNLLEVYRAGVRVGFGTDSGANPVRLPGYAEHRELALMVAAGLPPTEALACATGHNAELLGVGQQTGAIVSGKKADLLLVQGDPSQHIADTKRIVWIWHNGFAGRPWVSGANEKVR